MDLKPGTWTRAWRSLLFPLYKRCQDECHRCRGQWLAPEDPCRILIDFPEETLKIVARSEVVVLMPARVPVCAVELPLAVLRVVTELSHNDIDPLIGLQESGALFE